MILGNLLHRPVRALISVLAVAVEVTLILVIVGLSIGILNDAKTRQAGIGADVMVQPPGSSFLTGISGAPVSIKVADKLRQLPHVRVVSPVIWQLNTAVNIEVIYGIDLATFEALGSPFTYQAGGPFQGPNDILVDDFFARSNNAKVGSPVELFNHQFRVSGIVANGKGARRFVPIKTMQDLLGAEGKASIFYVKLDDPANADKVIEAVHNIPGMQQYVVRSMQQYLSMMTPGNLPGMSAFINTVIGVAVVIGFIVIFQSMYTAVMERTREIGILKSLGASKLYIINVIVRETLVVAVLGIIVGIVISYLTSGAIVSRIPTLRVIIQTDWVIRAIIIALIGSVLGALYPAFKAAQKDPIDALAYE